MNQTCQGFEYHILDNGSGDGTGKIIREYAERDKRIVPYFSHKNRDYTDNLDFWNLPKRIPEDDFFCILDADDFYDKTFFEEMLCFMKENQLEMAACGTIAGFIEQGNLQEAEAELADWEQILQGDEELAGLRDCLNQRKARKR